jgi:hypothetical protein
MGEYPLVRAVQLPGPEIGKCRSEEIMNSKTISIVLVALGSSTVAGVASAQEPDQVSRAGDQHLAPANKAVELTISTGYEQGLGNLVSGQPSLTDLGQAGGAVELGVGFRVVPQLTLGVYGSGGMFSRGDAVDGSTNLYTATAGLKADWHFLPAYQLLDPWISLGTGWRGYWVNDSQGTSSTQGWEIARLQVGLDYRVDQAIAIGPVLGADVSTFFTQAVPTSDGFQKISSPQASTFLFAGIEGRFDIPTASSDSRVASRR